MLRVRLGTVLMVLLLSGCKSKGNSGKDTSLTPSPDSGADSGLDTGTDTDSAEVFLGHCDSFFAARIAEQAWEQDASFSADCDVPLSAEVATLNSVGDALCLGGESANACRDRLYATPPSLLTEINPACRDQGGDNCLLGMWLPRCADGSDDGCIEDEALCQDGTRPMAFFAPAVGAPSDRWLFHMGGEGQPCSGDKCWFNYRYAAEESGKDEFETAMSTLHPDHLSRSARTGSGITSGIASNPLSGFNRVYLKRCSDSISTADEVVNLIDDQQQPVSTSVVYHHGAQIWQSLLHALDTAKGRDLDGDGSADLPAISDASQVLIAGSSDGSIWLTHGVDTLAATVDQLAGHAVDTRLVVDAYFDGGLDNEGRYVAGAAADFSAFTAPYASTQACALPDDGDSACPEACSDANYHPGPMPDGSASLADEMIARGSQLDASCEAAHGVGAAQCFDKRHVLNHHVGVPIFLVADQEDNVVSVAPVEQAESRCWRYPEPSDFRQRVLDQAYDLRAHWVSNDREEGPRDAEALAMMLRKQHRDGEPTSTGNHTHLGSDKAGWKMSHCEPNGTLLHQVAIDQFLLGWADGTAPFSFIVEDLAAWDGSSPAWVTGGICHPPQ